MRILVLTHRFPFPPDRGDRIRSYHLIRHLAARHRVAVAAVADGPTPPAHRAALEELGVEIETGVIGRERWVARSLVALAGTTPLSLPAFESPALRAAVRRRLTAWAPDVVLVCGSAMAQYVMDGTAIPRVIDFVDADSEKWQDYARRARFPFRLLYAREARVLRRWERRVAGVCARGLVASEREAVLLRPVTAPLPLTVLPNGVTVRPVERRPGGPPTLVFTGVMDYWPNVDAMTFFTREVLPLVRSQVPAVELRIVGQRPAAAIRRLARLPGVTVTGPVPDVLPHLAAAQVFVAPLRIARGIQNKMLEAMAAGLPVVGTPEAGAGIDAAPGRHLITAATPLAMAREITTLLGSPERRAALGQAATDFVRREHTWETCLVPLDEILDQATHDRLPRLVTSHA